VNNYYVKVFNDYNLDN